MRASEPSSTLLLRVDQIEIGRFYRSRQARGAPGSGLGLAIVHQVAEAHGGSVVAENAADGGASLQLSLPANDHLT